MMNRWGSENFICKECFSWDVLLLKLMHDYHLDEGMVKNTLHLITIIPFLYNLCHIVNVLREIVGYVKHFDSSEVDEESDVI